MKTSGRRGGASGKRNNQFWILNHRIEGREKSKYEKYFDDNKNCILVLKEGASVLEVLFEGQGGSKRTNGC